MKRKIKILKPCVKCGGEPLNKMQQGGVPPTGKCSGTDYGGKNCPPDSPQYMLAKSFRKQQKYPIKKDFNSVAEQNKNIDNVTQDKIDMFKNYVSNNATNVIAEEEMFGAYENLQNMMQFGGMTNYGFDPTRSNMDAYMQKVQEANLRNSGVGQNFINMFTNADFNREMVAKTKIRPEHRKEYRQLNKAYKKAERKGFEGLNPNYNQSNFFKNGGEDDGEESWYSPAVSKINEWLDYMDQIEPEKEIFKRGPNAYLPGVNKSDPFFQNQQNRNIESKKVAQIIANQKAMAAAQLNATKPKTRDAKTIVDKAQDVLANKQEVESKIRGNVYDDQDIENVQDTTSLDRLDKNGYPSMGVLYPKTGGLFGGRRGRMPLLYNPEHTYLEDYKRGPLGRTRMKFTHYQQLPNGQQIPMAGDQPMIESPPVNPFVGEAAQDQGFKFDPSMRTDFEFNPGMNKDLINPYVQQYGGPNENTPELNPMADTILKSKIFREQNIKNFLGPTMDFAANIGNVLNEPDYEQIMLDESSASNMFTPNIGGNRGFNTFNKVGFDPGTNQTPVQFAQPAATVQYGGQMYQEGGEYEMDDNAIQQFLAAGGQIEYI